MLPGTTLGSRPGATVDLAAMPGLVDQLAALPLFRNVDRDALTALVTRCEPVRLMAGSVVLRRGDPVDAAILLVSGQLQSSGGSGGPDEPEVTAPVRPGDTVGAAALFTRSRRQDATVTAEVDSFGLRLTRGRFGGVHDSPALAAIERSQLAALARRLRNENRAVRRAWKAAAPEPTAAAPSGDSLFDRLRRLLGSAS